MGRGCRLVVREYDPNKDLARVEDMERKCEVGSLVTHLMGDPVARVRQSPLFHMLVAETEGERKQIVGVIRGCVKTVTRGVNLSGDSTHGVVPAKHSPVLTKLAYISGLRVSPSHRRMGIASKLVSSMEGWFKQNDAEYSYTATENDNHASVKLFTDKCGYSKFRTPSIVVNPVFAHRLTSSHHVSVIQIPRNDAVALYRHHFSATEFFPTDIDAVLSNRLSLGTLVAVPRGFGSWPGSDRFISDPPESWAVVTLWSGKDVYQLEVRGASCVNRTLAKATRVLDRTMPFLGIHSVPDVFKPFGFLFMYGVGGEGPRAGKMVEALFSHARNVARERGCAVVVAEVASCEPLIPGMPRWKVFSDLWCVKRLRSEGCRGGADGDWTKSPPGVSIFVDPREI